MASTRSPLSPKTMNNVPQESPLKPFPPPSPADADDDTPPPPPPLVASGLGALSSAVLSVFNNEHKLSVPILLGGNSLAMVAHVLDLNMLNTLSWALLGCVMKGFTWSVVAPTKAAPLALTAAELQPYLEELVPLANRLRDAFSRIFECADPKLSLRAGLVFYAATLVSARVSAHNLAWCAFNLAFTLPSCLKSNALHRGAELAHEALKSGLAHPKAGELVQALAKIKEGFTPKLQFLGASALWFFYLSFSSKLLSLAFGALYLKSQGAITPKTEVQVGEAVDQIKKRARRMSMAARMSFGPPKAKAE